jgi:hypothetical protein
MQSHIDKLPKIPASFWQINVGLLTFLLLLAGCGGQVELSQIQIDQARNALLADQPEQARSILNGTFDSGELRNYADCLRARAWHAGSRRILENSIRYARSCLAKGPGSDEIRFILGSDLYLSGQWEQAKQWLAEPLNHPDYCGQAVRAFSEPAFEVNERLLDFCLSNNSATALEYGRRIAMLKGERATAMRYARQLMDSGILSPSTYYRLGLWFRVQNQDELSTRALEISHYLRAVIGRGESAADISDNLLENLTKLYELGFYGQLDLVLREIRWYRARGEKRRATKRLMELTRKPGVRGHMGLGLEAEAMGNRQVAIAWLRPLAEQGHIDARISLARIFAEDPRRKKEAQALLEELLSSHPYCGVCYLLLYQLNPVAPDAARLLERAQSLAPWDLEIQNYRAGPPI